MIGLAALTPGGGNATLPPGLDSGQGATDRQPRRPHILIVEDEVVIALMMRITLEDAGYAVTGIHPSAETALGAISPTDPPALVLMDISLRGELDGVQAAQRLRDRYPALRIAFMTGQADAATRQRAEAVLPDAYLIKPFTSEQLEAVVATVLRGATS